MAPTIDEQTPTALDRYEVVRAAARLQPLIRRTPTIETDGNEFGVDAAVTLKLELLQHSGSFKARGATNFITSQPISDSGVVAASGGNHGAAVAWAARELGHQATIFVPTISAEAKVARLRSYGAKVHQIGSVYAESLEASLEFQASSGATAIHAYEDRAVVAGAGTTGLEFSQQVETPLTTVLVACGGGGLAAGVATWFGQTATVVTCETEGTAAHSRALTQGQPVDVEVSGIAADALGATSIGRLPWACLHAAGATNIVVTDNEVVMAKDFLWDRFRLVAEPSAVVPAAALLSGRFVPPPGAHVGVIVCGANTSLSN